jgi:hypothetical protein
MRVRIIAELAMEIVSHANLCGAHAVPLPKVFAGAPENARAPKAVNFLLIGPIANGLCAAHDAVSQICTRSRCSCNDVVLPAIAT